MEKFLRAYIPALRMEFPEYHSINYENIGGMYIVVVERYNGSHFSVHIAPDENFITINRRLVRECERNSIKFEL